MTDWYLAHVPDDEVPYWDFVDPDIPDAPRDSSSAAIAASGMVDLSLADPSPARRDAYLTAARDDARQPDVAGVLSRWAPTRPSCCTARTRSAWASPTAGLAYGDAFFLEALLRLRRADPGVDALAIRRVACRQGRPRGRASTATSPRAGSSRGSAALELRLSEVRDVGAVRVALAGGDRRAAALVVSVSDDGERWRSRRSAR